MAASHLPCRRNTDTEECNHNLPPASISSLSLKRLPSLTSTTAVLLNQHHHVSSTMNHHCIATLQRGNYSSYVSSLTLGGKFLYVGSSNNEIRAWRRSPGNCEFEYSENQTSCSVVAAGEGAVKYMTVLADHKVLFSAHQDHKIRVWKIRSQEQHNQKFKFEQIATLPTLGDRTLNFLKYPNSRVHIRRHKTSTWVHHVDAVSSLALSPDQSLLYSVSWDRTLVIWRTSDFKCLETISSAHDDAINTVVVSEDGIIYTGSADGKIKAWKKLPGEKIKHSHVTTLEKHRSGINALALGNGGSFLYSGAGDKYVLAWKRDRDDKMVASCALRGHDKAILCLAVSRLDLICSGSADKTIRVWRVHEKGAYSCLFVLEGHIGPVKCLTIVLERDEENDTGNYVVYSGSLDSDVKVWKICVPQDSMD